jgi:hypothetical protein
VARGDCCGRCTHHARKMHIMLCTKSVCRVFVIRRIVSVDDDSLDILLDVSSTSSGIDAIDHHDVLRGPLDGIGVILV